MLGKISLGLGLFFLVTGISYAGNTSSYVDLEIGGYGLRTIYNEEDGEMLDKKNGEGVSAGLWVELFGGLRIGGDFEYTIIGINEKISSSFKVKVDKIIEKQANAGLSFSFLNFESSALYLKATTGLWTEVNVKLKNNDIDLSEKDLEPTIKQPTIYGGIGWFFSNVKGKRLKNVGTRIEIGYQTQRMGDSDEDEVESNLANIRVKGTLVYSLR